MIDGAAHMSCRVHPDIIQFVELTPDIFGDPDSNPRAWTYASRLLQAWEAGGYEEEDLLDALAGVVGESLAVAFLKYYQGESAPLAAEDVLENYGLLALRVEQWKEEARLDLVAASVEQLKRYLSVKKNFHDLMGEAQREKLRNVRLFLYDLPPDLKRQVRIWLKSHGLQRLTIPRTRNV